MTVDPLKEWAKSELKRLEIEEYERDREKKVDAELERRKQVRRERYLYAPSMNLKGEIIGRKSLSTGEKA